MDRPALPTEAGVTFRPYHYWAGRSGRTYVHGVYAPGERPDFAAAAAIVMVANRAGRRTPIDVAAIGTMPQLFFHGRRYARALARGANEIHLHLASDPAAATDAAADLAASVIGRRLRRGAGQRTTASGLV